MGENRHIGILGTLVTVIILILLIILTNVDTSKMSYFESLSSKITIPVQTVFTKLKNKITGNSNFFTTQDELKKENENLAKMNSELQENLREYEVLKAENEILKEKMNLTDKYYQYQTISADVINKDISNYGSNLVLNVGTDDGIKKGMTVIADQGLVGYIVSTTNNTSKVKVITDSASTVSCNISTTDESVICKGTLNNNQELRVTYIPMNADLIVGDSVETSGVGGVYVRGIHIGTITEIITTTNITDRYAIVETAVDFSKLKTVLVIKNN
ncbi:MAG: rod shape-determining protein MreC [Clostridia bacterium]|nr:rod shape-determining protein MreC [Clostridia bacterium]